VSFGAAVGHVAVSAVSLLGVEFVSRTALRGRSSAVLQTAVVPGAMLALGLVGVARGSGFVRSVATGLALNGALHLTAQGVYASDRDAWDGRSDLWSFVRY
jgi:hypothetical protein